VYFQTGGTEIAASDVSSVNTPSKTAEKRKFAPTDNRGNQILGFTPQTYFGGDKFTQDGQYYQEYIDWKTGFDNMDTIQPLYPGLYVLGAVSGVGKTTFMLQMADNLAESGRHVLYFCLEQTCFELFSKSLARRVYQNNPDLSNPPTSSEIRCGKALDRPEVKEQMDAYPRTVEDRLTIIECNFGITVQEIRKNVEDYIKYVGVSPIVIVDYLQIIAPSSEISKSKLSSKDNIDDIVHTLKAMQSDNQLVVIVISSFNRESYTSGASLDSFKESGGIEYTADVLWALQLRLSFGGNVNSETDNKQVKKKTVAKAFANALEQDPRLTELIYLKNRYGQANKKVHFIYFPKSDYFEPDYNL